MFTPAISMFEIAGVFTVIFNTYNGNIHGNKSSFLEPMVATINCILWVSCGFFQEKKRLAFRGS